ncbi:hypothetical protein PBT88_19510 [Sphingomonas abietis]|uniref:DNA primase/helicase Gp4 N-terminal Bacteriophage T7-like domain-containing protein n=1 Tax=Sphingomonas abietis TaxID=3012344 RepID=A0ABY7NQT7_9SPHN|nr:primase-helicase zinc-binding domain-containing protein [Sphingomonas abietis]WBO22304.1 hypothetical protein PBT88_19510 [Sphingomonas abietis]
MTKLCDLARNKWRSLLPHLGVKAEYLSNKHGPCPICGGKDRFRFDDKDGAGTYFCNACGAGDGVKLAMEVTGRTFADVAREIRETCGDMPASAPKKSISADEALKRMRRLWDGAVEIRPGDDAARYLASRGVAGPFCGDLRLHPDCPVQGPPGPIALARDAGTDPCAEWRRDVDPPDLSRKRRQGRHD